MVWYVLEVDIFCESKNSPGENWVFVVADPGFLRLNGWPQPISEQISENFVCPVRPSPGFLLNSSSLRAYSRQAKVEAKEKKILK